MNYDDVIAYVEEHGEIPPGFNDWTLIGHTDDPEHPEWTIAHELAKRGKLPPDFNQWEIRSGKPFLDEEGYEHERRTVAHIAARYATLPDSVPIEVLVLIGGPGDTTVFTAVRESFMRSVYVEDGLVKYRRGDWAKTLKDTWTAGIHRYKDILDYNT